VKKIFVSYSRSDSEDFAERIQKHLTSFEDVDGFKEYDVFIDKSSIRGGEVWSNTIENNISNCHIFVVILTDGSLRSPFVDKEVIQAQKEEKNIIPCFHKNVIGREIKWRLDRIHGVEFTTESSLARELYSIISKIKGTESNIRPDPITMKDVKTDAITTTKLDVDKQEQTVEVQSPPKITEDDKVHSFVEELKKEVITIRSSYSEELKQQLAKIRQEKNIDNLKNFVVSLKDIKNQEAGVIVDIFLSYRALAKKKEDWEEMADFVTLMPEPLSSTTLVEEQHAFALNRAGHSEEAERILLSLIGKKGPSSERYGLLGGVYKDRWEKEYKEEGKTDNNDEFHVSEAYLDQAIDAYLKGFENDSRGTNLGINAVILMEKKREPDPRKIDLIPIIKYTVHNKITNGKGDYWDYATLLELAILAKDKEASFNFLAKALTHLREGWEGETTLKNLRILREAREKRNEVLPWTKKIEDSIEKKIM
jgi:MAP3K TRAFs-binding domain/TIR domain